VIQNDGLYTKTTNAAAVAQHQRSTLTKQQSQKKPKNNLARRKQNKHIESEEPDRYL
jgi:hypothetical protein